MNEMDKQRAYDDSRLVADVAETQQPTVDRGTLKAKAVGCGTSANYPGYRATLREQLEKTAAGDGERHRRLDRAHSILVAHPEFEEFLELQDLINRGLFR